MRNLKILTEPALWKQLLYAFPSVWFAMNLFLYYALYWIVYVTRDPEELRANRITREGLFEEIEIAGYEVLPLVIAAFVATFLLIAVSYGVHAAKRRKEA